ncbi:MAG: hypothetical protein H6988_08465 [Pseudomonadales bacterium]|nr:hypothetical protein [Ardenticatenaceae bacterium]MCP5190411.1 hypothetical protein [Pseudomonadales bacterium]
MDKKTALTPLQIGIIGLTLITAVIHLVPLGIMFGSAIFILNGLGYLGLLGALLLPIPFLLPYRGLVRWAFIAYTVVTIILYFVMNPDALTSVLGLLTKAIEAVLVVLLFLDGRK